MNRAITVVMTAGALGMVALVFWVTDAERRAAAWEAKARTAEYSAENAKLAGAIFGLAYWETVNIQAENAETRKLVAALYGLPANRGGAPLPALPAAAVEPDIDLDFGGAAPNPPGSVIVWERKANSALVFHFKDPAALTAPERGRVVSADEMTAMAKEEWGPKKRKEAEPPAEDNGAIPAGAGDNTE